MIHDTPLSQDASTHQIWNSLLKEYKIYTPDTIILKTRSEIKVTVTQKWYVTPRHPKIHLHIKFRISIIIIIIGFLINVQVQGHHPHQWAPFQVTG